MYRWILAGFFFLVGLIAYMDRANMAVVAHDIMRTFSIDEIDFALLNTYFFAAYALMQVPAGVLTQRFGNKTMTIAGLLAWSLFTVLTPLAGSLLVLACVRALFGVGESPIYASNAAFNNQWFGAQEKARAASFVLAGSYFGPVIAPFISVQIIQAFGWQSVFYIFGAAGVVLAAVYFFVSSSRPEDNRFIGKKELAHILATRAHSSSAASAEQPAEPSAVPWRKLLLRGDILALALGYFMCIYIYGMFMVWLPQYLLAAKGMSLAQMGIYAGAPWLALTIGVAVTGALSDRILARSKSLFKARVLLAMGGFVGFIICICVMILTSSYMLSILMLSISFGFVGLPICACWALCIDKGRALSAAVSSYMNLWGSSGAAISPIVVGYMAKHIGWTEAIAFNILPAILGIAALAFVRAGRALEDN